MCETAQTPSRIVDSRTGIAPDFRHIVAGMHLGRMTPIPHVEEFEAVLTLAADEGVVENGIRHRHLHLPYGPDIDLAALDRAATWVQGQVQLDRRVLVRSEGGRERPALLIGVVIVRWGGTEYDALRCLRSVDPSLLTDFRYRRVLSRLGGALSWPAPPAA